MNLSERAREAYTKTQEMLRHKQEVEEAEKYAELMKRLREIAADLSCELKRCLDVDISAEGLFLQTRFQVDRTAEVEGIIFSCRWQNKEPYLVALQPCDRCDQYDQSYWIRNLSELGQWLAGQYTCTNHVCSNPCPNNREDEE